MAEFTRDELRELLAQTIGPLVTITMPIVRPGSDQQQNVARFKNLIREAARMLREWGVDKHDIEPMMAPAWDLLNNGDAAFQRDGLAVFISAAPTTMRYYNVGIPLDEKVIVGDRFHVKSLMPALTSEGRFYVLTLSQNQVHFLEAVGSELHQIEVPGLPENMDTALQLTNEGRNDGVKAVGASGRPDAPGTQTGIGGQSGSFAGHGAGEEDKKEYIQQYFHVIDSALQPILKDKDEPLVLVAVDYHHPLYKQANTYKHLTEEGIIGNPTGYTAQDILQKAHEIVDPLFRQDQQVDKDRYQELFHKNQASNRLDDILQAAYMGRIDSLFVPLDTELWGTYDFNAQKLSVHDAQQPGDADLLDLAATQTILNGGTVYAVPRQDMPDGSAIAAVYRYTL